MAAQLDTPSTGIPWIDAVVKSFRRDPMGGIGPSAGISMGANLVSPSARRGLQFVAEQAAERIPNRAKLAELLGKSGQIRPLAEPAATLPSNLARAQSVMGDVSGPKVLAGMLEEQGIPPGDLMHYVKLLNKLFGPKGSPAASNIDQAGAYELLLLELLGGRLP